MMTLQEAASVMIAAAHEKELEYRSCGSTGKWYPWNIRGYASCNFNFADMEYRVKPEKRHWVIRQASGVSPNPDPYEVHRIYVGINDLDYWLARGFIHVVEV